MITSLYQLHPEHPPLWRHWRMHGSRSSACLHLCVPLWSGTFPKLSFCPCNSFVQVTADEYPYTSGDPWGEGDDQKCKCDARTTEVNSSYVLVQPRRINPFQQKQAHRCLPQRWGSTLCHITTSLRSWTTWQTAVQPTSPCSVYIFPPFTCLKRSQDRSPHQWPPQTGVSTMVACLTDVPTTRI